MKKFSVLAFVMIISISGLLTGCKLFKSGEEPSASAKEVIGQGISNWQNVKSAQYDVSLSADSKDEVQDTSIDADVTGLISSKDPLNPLFSLAVDGNVTVNDDGYDVTAELRILGGKFYALISKFPEIKGAEGAFDQYIGTWWTLPSELGSSATSSVPMMQSTLTPKQKQMFELLKNASLFTDLEFEGIEKAGGVDCYSYTGVLDSDGIAAFMQELAKSNGSTMSESQIQSAKENIESMNFEGEVWISVNDMILRKITGTMSKEDTDKIEFSVEANKVNEDLALEIPEGAQEMSQEMLAPLMMLGAGIQGSVTE